MDKFWEADKTDSNGNVNVFHKLVEDYLNDLNLKNEIGSMDLEYVLSYLV